MKLNEAIKIWWRESTRSGKVEMSLMFSRSEGYWKKVEQEKKAMNKTLAPYRTVAMWIGGGIMATLCVLIVTRPNFWQFVGLLLIILAIPISLALIVFVHLFLLWCVREMYKRIKGLIIKNHD